MVLSRTFESIEVTTYIVSIQSTEYLSLEESELWAEVRGVVDRVFS